MKNKPVEPKEPKPPKPDYSTDIENINKSLKNIVGLTLDEINDKINAPAIVKGEMKASAKKKMK